MNKRQINKITSKYECTYLETNVIDDSIKTLEFEMCKIAKYLNETCEIKREKKLLDQSIKKKKRGEKNRLDD